MSEQLYEAMREFIRATVALEVRRGLDAVVTAEALDDQVRTAVTERIADLYRGTWDEEEGYRKGDMVTAAGSLWVARSDAPGRPGDGEGWQLAVKRGRDGKR